MSLPKKMPFLKVFFSFGHSMRLFSGVIGGLCTPGSVWKASNNRIHEIDEEVKAIKDKAAENIGGEVDQRIEKIRADIQKCIGIRDGSEDEETKANMRAKIVNYEADLANLQKERDFAVKIEDVKKKIQACEVIRDGSEDEETKAGQRAKIAAYEADLANLKAEEQQRINSFKAEQQQIIDNLNAEKQQIQNARDHHTAQWGACILMTILVILLSAYFGVRHARQEGMKEKERITKFTAAVNGHNVYLAGLEEQLKTAPDTPIDIDDSPLNALQKEMETAKKDEIDACSELTERAATLKVVIGKHNRRIERLPFDVPFRTAKDSAENAKRDAKRYDPQLLNEEALRTAEDALQTVSEAAKSIEDAQSIQNLQEEFKRIHRESFRQTFDIMFTDIQRLLEKEEINQAEGPLQELRKFFDTHREAMRPGTEGNLQALESKRTEIIGERNKAIEQARLEELQKKFAGFQKTFNDLLIPAQSLLEKADALTEKDIAEKRKFVAQADDSLQRARKFFNDNTEAMLPQAEAALNTAENDCKRIETICKNMEDGKNFATLYTRAKESYEDAAKNPNDLRDELLDTDALDRAKKLFADVSVVDQTRFSELETQFTTLIDKAITQRSQELMATIEPLANEHQQAVADKNLTPPQRYGTLTTLVQKINEFVEKTERETANRRPVTGKAMEALGKLLTDAKRDLHEVYPQAITQTVGDLDLYLSELQHVGLLKDFRSPDFMKVLENPDSFCFETTRSWNQFVRENSAALTVYPPSAAACNRILAMLNKDTVGLASVPEVDLMKQHKKYYEDTALRVKKLRDYMLRYRISHRIDSPYMNSINKKIIDIADSTTSLPQAMFALFDLLEQIANDKSEPACLRLQVAGALVNGLAVVHREYLHLTVSWRSRYGSLASMMNFGDSRCRNKTCPHHKEAEKLLAALPIGLLRSYVPRLAMVKLPEPPLAPQALRDKNLVVEYVWVGWVDYREGKPVVRIKQENIPKTNFESTLYAKLPDAEIMEGIGDLLKNETGIVPTDKQGIRCGTPVYVRRQYVPESKP